ncbi:uncharacterized protein EI97DRAFT_431612 [Westerdykella ornata]|uniref:PH domain-containing protein n=1 Tax=Westerdykella ornata TaxID=318751 RepID=A0A6A6JPD0_WESOR|nr:uncharacterized protein EI97DRAFT_431612 [Westerdykella ornata]KAF2278382.1 hypothetical protein EI97DRAFT_431612 [Westerdykella ornata]
MATPRPTTPAGPYQSIPTPQDPAHLNRGYGAASHLGVETNDFAVNHGEETLSLSQTPNRQHSQRAGRFEEDFDARTRGSSVLADGDFPRRSVSRASSLNRGSAPARTGTLKKRNSVKRSGSLKRSGSRRSMHAGSIRGVSIDDDDQGNEHNSVFYTPVPTSGSPTDILANRFQAWRKLLKDLITYFREVSLSYEHRAKATLKVSNLINNTVPPSVFMTEGGLNDASRLLRDFHSQAITEANKARDIMNEVINQLSGLRSDLGQKIKEIKSLSGDFKNSVEKEKETTRKCVAALGEALSLVDTDPAAIAGKGDPYVVRLGVDRQVERQIDEENYLHRAYLNLENSGRELESIVVGEIQKAYNALASILKHEADEIYSTVDRLRDGPIGMPRDFEWNEFVLNDPHFVNPNIPLRRLEDIEYPGKHHPATTEVRAGMLERKSKYLKSYTPGWYVLSPTHLHEFKSADRIYTQPPVMSLYLPDQKLGSHSQPGSSSHKFALKGRQTGSMHRGHTWVFRAETYDTMLAWYEDIKSLTEKSGEERNAFVRRHARSASQGSARSVSTDGGLEEDEADRVPYASKSVSEVEAKEEAPPRPSPGGRFPSDIQVQRNLQAPLPPSSGSSEVGNDLTTVAGGLNQAGYPDPYQATSYDPASSYQHQHHHQYASATANIDDQQQQQGFTPYAPGTPSHNARTQFSYNTQPQHSTAQPQPPQDFKPVPSSGIAAAQTAYDADLSPIERHNSAYGDRMTPVAGGAAAGALGVAAYNQQFEAQDAHLQPPATGTGSAPMPLRADSSEAPIPVSAPTGSETGQSSAETPVTELSESTYGGSLEKERVFPAVMRQKTDLSVSDLHVPGEYPRIPRK